MKHVGQKIEGIKAPITVTEGGLAAAAHRAGPDGVRQYLDRLERNGWKSDINEMPEGSDKERREKDKLHAIETRLREFERVPPRRGNP